MRVKRITPFMGVLIAAVLFSAACKTYEAPAAMIFVTAIPDFANAYVASQGYPGYPSSVPASVSGKFVLDTDKDLSNGYAKAIDFAVATSDLATTNGITGEFSDVVEGSYYIYVVVDTEGNGDLSLSLDNRDAFAFYGSTTTVDYNVASKARLLTVVDGYSYDCDFWVGIPYNHG